MSYSFKEFRAKTGLHFTVSPPHDHDLNPIAERIIGLIAETATAIRIDSSRQWVCGARVGVCRGGGRGGGVARASGCGYDTET